MDRSSDGIPGVRLLVLSGLLAVSACSVEAVDKEPSEPVTEETARTTTVEQETVRESGGTAGGDEGDEPAPPQDAPDVQLSAEGAEPRPGVAAETEPDELVEQAPADLIIEPVISQQHGALENPDRVDWDAVVAVADAHLLESIEVAVLEYNEIGWSQVGAPELVSSAVLQLDRESDPPTAWIEACLDHSGVDVVDADGASLVDPGAPSRVKSILTVHYVDGRWVATAQDFTDELSC